MKSERSIAISQNRYKQYKKLIQTARLAKVKTLEDFDIWLDEVRSIHKIKKVRKVGKKSDYHAYIKSSEWFKKRKKYIEKVGKFCEVCKTKKGINLHHMTYERLGKEYDEDMLFVCKVCHHQIHFGEKGIKTTDKLRMFKNLAWWKQQLI